MTTLHARMIGVALMGLPLLIPAESNAATIFPPGSIVAGRTIGEWTGEWWNWTNSVPSADNPLTDPTGARANLNQNAAVYFVAGNTGGLSTRSFIVPGDKPLLIPLLNVTYHRTPEDVDAGGIPPAISGNPRAGTAPANADFVEQFTRTNFLTSNPATSLFFELDGVAIPQGTLLGQLEGTRYTSVIPAGSRSNVVFNEQVGSWPESYTIGYWVMLEPLGSGTHTLRFGGTRRSGTSIEVQATVTVAPEPSSLALGLAGVAGLIGYRLRAFARRC